MNIIQKLDDWYKEWYGESHLNTSNIPTHDSAEAQDFARYCVDEYKDLVSGDQSERQALHIDIVMGSALKDDERVHYEALQECCKNILKTIDSGKVPQRGIIGLRLLLPK